MAPQYENEDLVKIQPSYSEEVENTKKKHKKKHKKSKKKYTKKQRNKLIKYKILRNYYQCTILQLLEEEHAILKVMQQHMILKLEIEKA